jgi:peptidylprolyl isomerase
VEVTKEFPVAHKEVLGTIVFKLYGNIDPLTCQNFRELATGQHGYGYEGTLFNHIILGCLMQAGHVVTPSGQRGQVVYSRTLTGMSIF